MAKVTKRKLKKKQHHFMDCDIEVMIGKIEGKTDKNVYYLEAEVLAASEISEGDRSGECCELQAADF